jgi:hypothetical protein
MATTPTTRVTVLARSHQIDIDTGTYPTVSYGQLLGIEEAKLVEDRRTEDDEAYDDAGAMREAVTGYSWRLEIKLAYSTNLAGTLLDTIHSFLRTKFKATRSSTAQASEFGVRFYNRSGLDDGHSQEGRVYVKSWSMSGGKGKESIDIVLQGQGALSDITNPNASLTPTVSSISPTGGTTAGGTMVNVYGTHFTGTTGSTGVKFGTNNATSYVVVNDGLIVAVAPSGSAGTVQVKVTNTGGASADTTADDYTYA